MLNGRWDRIPVWGVYMKPLDESPETGNVTFDIPRRVQRVDGRVIYASGASSKVTVGNVDQHDNEVRSAVKIAWKAVDATAAGDAFDEVAWETWWDTKVVPAAIFTSFPAADDQDIVGDDLEVRVTESFSGATGKVYYIRPLIAHLALAIPGVNLGTIEVPPGAPTAPAPVYAKGIAGGVASLGEDGKVPLEQLPEDLGGGLDAEAIDEHLGTTVALADVARTGRWDDIVDPPTIPAVPENLEATLAGKVDLSEVSAALAGSTDTSIVRRAHGRIKAETAVESDDVVNLSQMSTALSAKADTSALATKADLVGGVLPTSQLPPLAVNDVSVVASQAAMLGLPAQRGDMAVRTDVGRTYVLSSDSPGTLADWKEVQAAGQVLSVNDQTGTISLTASNVGAVPTTRAINGQPLSGDVTLTASDVGAAPAGVTHDLPTIFATSATTWPDKTTTLAAMGLASYTGPVRYDGATYMTKATWVEPVGRVVGDRRRVRSV